MTTTAQITSVWSSYGHRFMSTDDEQHESCLTCGAMYALVPDAEDPAHGTYQTASGGTPADCTHDTSLVHGYPGERHCDECDECDNIDGCTHCTHSCPCIFCDS